LAFLPICHRQAGGAGAQAKVITNIEDQAVIDKIL
jgi:hypothetical protein